MKKTKQLFQLIQQIIILTVLIPLYFHTLNAQASESEISTNSLLAHVLIRKQGLIEIQFVGPWRPEPAQNLKDAILNLNKGGFYPGRFWIWINPNIKSADAWFDPTYTIDNEVVLQIHPQTLGANGGIGTLLVHEAFHLYHAQFRPNEMAWLKEGLALMQVNRTLGRTPDEVRVFQQRPNVSLLNPLSGDERTRDRGSVQAVYGQAYLFLNFLDQICGPKLTHHLIHHQSQSQGLLFVDQELRKLRSQEVVCSDLQNAFLGFYLALYQPDLFPQLIGFPKLRLNFEASEMLGEYSARIFVVKESQPCLRGTLISRDALQVCLEVQTEIGHFLRSE